MGTWRIRASASCAAASGGRRVAASMVLEGPISMSVSLRAALNLVNSASVMGWQKAVGTLSVTGSAPARG